MEELPEEEKSEERGGGEDGAGGKKSKAEDGGWSPRRKLPRLSPADSEVDEKANDTAAAAVEVKEENVDSGISGDKSESDERKEYENPDVEQPGNSVVNAGPSTSSVAWILGIRRPIRPDRHYRRHWASLNKSASDDSMSDVDSDDISMGDPVGDGPSRSGDESRPIVDEDLRSVTPRSEEPLSESLGSPVEHHATTRHSSDTSNVDNDQSDSDDFSHRSSDLDTPDQWTDAEAEQNEDNREYMTPSALMKTKPKHNWFLMKELMNREMGLTTRPGLASKANVLFEQRYYGSLHSVYRLELMYKLNRHRGCVNSINFHPEGDLLASGSDDLNVVIWDWSTDTVRQVLRTGHKSNVFQSRFLHLNARSQLNIVTCARDGHVRLLQCPPSGGSGADVVRRKLASHSRSAHKLHVSAAEPHLVMSCGEDGVVLQADVRSDHSSKLFTVTEKGSPVALYSIHGHPLEPREVAVSGRNSYVRVYDRRKATEPLSMFCPKYFTDILDNASKRRNYKYMSLYVTCAVYNHDGSEILASYNDDDIYLFTTATDCYDKDSTKEGYTRRYSGHRNSATFKGVAFFGPRSEFVVSGSDCGYIYMWEKQTEAIAQWMLGDVGGVVNCIESHPSCPVLASSGLDKDVKIWVPSNEIDPLYTGLKEVVNANNKAQLRSPLFNDFLPTLYSAFHQNSADFPERDDNPRGVFNGSSDFDGQVCTTF